MESRKSFQNLPASENPQFEKDGKEIYIAMKIKYPNQTIEHLDNILNGLCAALNFLMANNVQKDNHRTFVQLIHKILTSNLDEE